MNSFLRPSRYVLTIGGFIALTILAGCAFVSLPTAGKESTAVATPVVTLKDGETYDLTSAPVEKKIGDEVISMIAYNGSVPGPLIKATQGSTINIRFTNNTSVPDTIHFHGIRMANAFDGVADVTQPMVAPGETFTYTLTLPDDGVYMYHPHMRTSVGIEAGLYGNLIVLPKDETAYAPVNRALPLLLDDVLIENGKLPGTEKDSPVSHALMGRFGNTMLVNGKEKESFTAHVGEVVRFYVTNIANTRTFDVTLLGAKLKLVGGDNGRFERETFVERVQLAPGERAIVDAYFPEAGAFTLTHRTSKKIYTLGTVTVESAPITPSFEKEFQTLRANNDVTASLADVRALRDTPPQKTLDLTLGMAGMGQMGGGMMHDMNAMGGMAGMHHPSTSSGQNPAMMHDTNTSLTLPTGDGIEWEDAMGQMNTAMTADTTAWQLVDGTTQKTNLAIDDWRFKKGELVKIRIQNSAIGMHPMQHPIHFHGNRFTVIAADGELVDNLVWKDTALIPAGGTIDIVLEAENPGTWLGHCHILEHAESGMVMSYVVEDLPSTKK